MLLRRPPLIMDSEGLLARHLFRNGRTASLMSTQLSAAVDDAAELERPVVIYDADALSPYLKELLERPLKVRMVMITSATRLERVPQNLIARVAFIQIAQPTLAREMFSAAFLNFFDPEMLPRLAATRCAETRTRVELDKFARDTLNRIAAVAGKNPTVLFDDEEALTELLKAKECYFAALTVSSDFHAIRTEHRLTIEPFLTHISFCDNLWTAVSCFLRHLSPAHVFPLDRFLSWVVSSISSSGLKPGIIQPDQHKVLRRSIIASCLKGLLPALPLEHCIFTLFCAGFIDAVKLGKIAIEDFEMIATHLAGQRRARIETGASEIKSEMLDEMKFINIVNVFPWIHKFIGTVFGANYTNFVPTFSVDSFLSPSCFTPSLILMRPGIDPLPLLDHVVAMRNRVDSFELFSMSDDEAFLAKFPEAMHNAMSTGSWVAI
jgi:hypothetical protein